MIKLLVRNRLRALLSNLFGKGGTSKKANLKPASRGKIIGFAILYIYLIAYFLFVSASLAVSLAVTFIPAGADWFYFGMFLLIDFGFLFMFSIFETKSGLFECKDNDLLLAMPIKPRDIVISRIAVVLIYNYLEQLLIMAPCIVVYAIYSKNIVGVIGAVIASVFIPFLSAALSSAVGYLIAMISRRIIRKTLVTTVVSLVFFVVFFLGYSALLSNTEELIGGIGTEVTVTPETSPLLYQIGSIATFKPLNMLLFAFVSALAAFVAFFLISKGFIKITTDTGVSKKAVYKGEISDRKSPLFALVGKEMRKFFSSTNYIMNSAIGTLFMIIAGVIALINRSALSEAFGFFSSEHGLNDEFIYPLLIAATAVLSCMNMQSASALSLEGRNLWCVKSMPVSDREVLLSKAVPQMIITLPPTLVSSVLFIIAFSAPVKYWIFFILTPVFANILFAFLGIVMNVAFPKFNFENEVQPIKQSMSVFLTMMSQLVFSLLLIGLNTVVAILGFPIIAAFLTLGILVGLALLFYFILMGPCVRKYASIDP